jgi:hypothetical protein
MSRLLTAKDAAILLGRPELARTLARRAEEAWTNQDEHVQRIGDRWGAELEWWQSVARLRPPGRKRREEEQP